MGKIKVAAVGLGVWGINIVRVLKSLENDSLVSLEAVVDIDERRAREVAEKFSVRRYLTDVGQVPSLGIQAATVAVPIDYLVGVGKELAVMGVHVFVEKPVSMGPEDIRSFIEVVRASNVVAQPGYIVRYDPAAKALREAIAKRDKPRYLIFKRLSRRPQHRRKFPIVYDLMVHDIDLALYLISPKSWNVLSVHASDIEENVPQVVSAHLRVGSSHVLLISDGILPVKVREAEAITRTAYIKASFTDRTIEVLEPEGRVRKKAYGEEPLRLELIDFLRRIKGEKVPNAPTLDDALRVCEIATAIHGKEFG